MYYLKKITAVVFILTTVISALYASATKENYRAETTEVEFTDSCGRQIIIPESVTRIAPSGATATMFCSVIAPEYMTNINSPLTDKQIKYMDNRLASLPVTGQFYGSKATLNIEEIIATEAQLIIDMGDIKNGMAEDLDALQAQTGIPCIFIEADLEHMAEAFRKLGLLLDGKKERGEALASFIEKTIKTAKMNSAKIMPNEIVRVMFTGASDGLGTNPKGSSQAQVIELIGAENAVVLESFSSKGNGNIINMEQLYIFNPDLIVFSPDSIYSQVDSDPAWSSLLAVKNHRYYEVPGEPYNWLGNPPSLNMILGIWWLGKTVYPQYFTYNMEDIIKEAFDLFWNYKLNDSEIKELL